MPCPALPLIDTRSTAFARTVRMSAYRFCSIPLRGTNNESSEGSGMQLDRAVYLLASLAVVDCHFRV